MSLNCFDSPIMTDEEMDIEMEMEIAAMDGHQDLLNYLEISQDSDLKDSNSSEEPHVKTTISNQGTKNPSQSPAETGRHQWKEPTYTIDPEIFYKRKSRVPLYLLNPNDYPDDHGKQMQIRRATITYRHHQQKKELIRHQAEEIMNLKSVLQIYDQREEALAKFCTCETALKIIRDFDPKKYLVDFPPLEKYPLLPPLRRPQQRVDLSPLSRPPAPLAVQSWTPNRQNSVGMENTRITRILQMPQLRTVVLTPPPTPPKTAFEALKAERAAKAEEVLRTHLERLNRLQSPGQQVNEVSKTVKNTEVELIMEQMNLAQVTSELQTKKKANCSNFNKNGLHGTLSTVAMSHPNNTITLRPPNTSTSALAQTRLHIQTPNGMKVLAPTGVGYLSPTIFNQLTGGRTSGMQGASPIGLKIIPGSFSSSPNAQISHFPSMPIKVESGMCEDIKLASQPVEEPTPLQQTSEHSSLLIPKKEPVEIIQLDDSEDDDDPIAAQDIVADNQNIDPAHGIIASKTTPTKIFSDGAPGGITRGLPILPLKIKEEPLDVECRTSQRRSQRSAALNRPNTKDLLKGIVNKTQESGMNDPENDELTYARPCKRIKEST